MNLITKSILNLTISLLSLVAVFSQDIIGSWHGTLKVQGVELKIVFHVEKQDSAYISLMDSPTQGGYGIATSKTTFKNEQLEVAIASLGVLYQGKLKNDSIKGTFSQSEMSIPLTLTRTEKKELVRPQMPNAPYPYNIEDVTFTNTKENINLAGTLTFPKGNKTFPAVILIAGSGPNDRDETIFGHKPFWVLADYLTRQGIAVLRYDKRGVEKSEGEYFLATSQDFAEDTEAAFNYLKGRKEIDSSNIGLIGHSEGGVIAPIVAVKNEDLKFVVLMAGVGVSGMELVLEQHQHIFDKTTLNKEEKKNLNSILRNIYTSVLTWEEYVGTDEERNSLKQELETLWQNLPKEMRGEEQNTSIKEEYIEKTVANITSPWFRHFLKTNTSGYLEKLTIPILAINGENDTQVNYQINLKEIEHALKKANNKHYTIKSYPHLNHLFQKSTTGEIDEYRKIEHTISLEVLSDIAIWIKQQVE